MSKIDEQQIIKNTKSMQKMQEIADRIYATTGDLTKTISSDSILKPSKLTQEQLLLQSKKIDNIQDSKQKKGKGQQSTSANKNELNSIEWVNKLQEIQQQHNEDKKKLREELIARYVQREMEFKKTIDELQQELRSRTALDQTDKKVMEMIYKDHSKIIDGINNIQLRTSKILVDQERDIIRFFNNKINEIKKQFQEEREKKGQNDKEYIQKENQLISELEWIKKIAQKIDDENHQLMQKYKELKVEYQTQERDREMLMKELIIKKKENAILKSQIQQYEKLLNDVQKEDDQESNQDQILDKSGVKNQKTEKSKQSSSQQQVRFPQITNSQVSQSVDEVQKAKYQNIIKTYQDTQKKEQKRLREIKQLYIKELSAKTELYNILRQCIEDIKEEIIQVRSDERTLKKNKNQSNEEVKMEKEDREKLIENLLKHERVIQVISDKIFYDKKNYDETMMQQQYEETNYNDEQY
ncbi:unnamed protein product (macronuclear) [Paramecium tetraurelia]|uniref:Growth arrest-specific protein 8 domain-containing protein n=1 Tax=Paramecium tetraurelia TaxID=5888 RepID=A0BQK3_PARTE|nr:uncharacterized protein GSPATT00031049001 [Paramecium tetraurelia]CAK60820.1 unnamed protein product [Paramecium tetraurelia]|eukprot:XP_001428218.1 hypothetical protein (macronuclear) [Paramecium tetraurelia strain d4-2]